MKESFIFYRSFYEALKELSKEDRVEIIDAICELALNENEVELKSGIQKAMFALMKPQIEANNKRYANGCKAKTKHREGQEKEEIEPPKSGREAKRKQKRSETEAKAKQEASKLEANENVNDNDNENVNEKEKEIKENSLPSSDDTCVQGEKDKKAEKIPYDSIIGYLNEKAGKNFSAQSKSTRSKIKARWNEGYRLIDFEHVIDVKVVQWLNDEKMEGYLRPDTLFGPKFEGYLNETHKPKMNTGLPDWYANPEKQLTPEEQEKKEKERLELLEKIKKEEERRKQKEEESKNKQKDAETQNTDFVWPF